MADRIDVVIVGAGPSGEVAAGALLAAGKSVALIERKIIGGKCSNWGFDEDVRAVNPDATPAELVLRIDAGAGFADLVEVKDATPAGVP